MSVARVDYDVENGIARLVLNQPARLNAMSLDMWSSLPGLVQRAIADPTVRLIAIEGAIIEGRGSRAFCAGADISQFGEQRSGTTAVGVYDQAVRAGLAALSSGPKPTVALLRGICYGGGLALALSCDVRLAAEDARFCIPAAKLGLGFAYANIDFMVRRIGLGATADILYSARSFDAREAQRLGVATHVFATAQFEAESLAYLATIAANAPLTLNAIALALRELDKPEADRDSRQANEAVAACFASEDYAEGRRAFAQKTAPSFKGR